MTSVPYTRRSTHIEVAMTFDAISSTILCRCQSSLVQPPTSNAGCHVALTVGTVGSSNHCGRLAPTVWFLWATWVTALYVFAMVVPALETADHRAFGVRFAMPWCRRATDWLNWGTAIMSVRYTLANPGE